MYLEISFTIIIQLVFVSIWTVNSEHAEMNE